MDFNLKHPSSIRRTISYVEWSILTVYFLLFLLNRSETNYSSLPIPTYVRLAQLITLAALSFLFPINRPIWQRRTYILLEILAIMIPASFGIYFHISLYFILVKSCFLLKRKEVVFATIVLGIVWNFIIAFSLPRLIEFNRANLTQIIATLDNTNLIISRTIIENTGD